MPHKRPSKHLRTARPLSSSHAYGATKHDGNYVVRTVAGANAQKPYRCPGCSQTIPVGLPHLVAWPYEPDIFSGSGVEQRRHWHKSCWERRA